MSGVSERAETRRDWPGRIGKFLFGLGVLNFTVFWVVAICIGGDAIDGKVENGHYYLNSRGFFTEVSAGVYWYSWVHTVSAFVTLILGMFGMLLWAYSWQKRPLHTGNEQSTGADAG